MGQSYSLRFFLFVFHQNRIADENHDSYLSSLQNQKQQLDLEAQIFSVLGLKCIIDSSGKDCPVPCSVQKESVSSFFKAYVRNWIILRTFKIIFTSVVQLLKGSVLVNTFF